MELFNWDDYCDQNNKIAINVRTLDEEQQLFDLFNQKDLHLRNGNIYKGSSFYLFKENTCYSNQGYIQPMPLDFFKNAKYKIFSFQEVLTTTIKQPLKATILDWFV